MKLIILDQTGVINQSSDTFIKTPDEWIPIPGSLEAIARLTHSGYRVIIAANQSGIGRGLLDMATYNAINDKMYKAVNQAGGRIDAIFFCPHSSTDKCSCRKPATGLFDEIMQRYGVNLSNVPAIGDSLKDLQAAVAVKRNTHSGVDRQRTSNPYRKRNARPYPDFRESGNGR